MELKPTILEDSPFKILEGRLVAYNCKNGTIIGKYKEVINPLTKNYSMCFQPSVVNDAFGTPEIVYDLPTITTDFSGTMRPIKMTIEDLVESIKKSSINKK